jgi:hypothetical protein
MGQEQIMIGTLGVEKTQASLHMIEGGGLYVDNPECFHGSSTRCGGYTPKTFAYLRY